MLKAPAIAVRPVNHPGVKPAKSVWRGTNAIPSWSWQGCEGNKAVMEVYTDAAQVELSLNGKLLKRKKVKEGKAVFQVRYAPGVLSAVAFATDGKELGRSQLQSAEGPIQLLAEPEESQVRAGEIVYIPISLVGENGVVERNADRMLTVTVENGELLAFGSANPRTEERYDSSRFTTYHGRALAVVRAGESRTVTLSVTDGERTDTAEIAVR